MAEVQRQAAEWTPAHPEWQEALGVLWLVVGNLEKAGRVFEELVISAPERASLYSSLALLSLQRYRESGRGRELILALGHVDKAIALQPNQAMAKFNLGVILEELTLRNSARSLWQDYLIRFPNSSWRGEVEERVQKLTTEIDSVGRRFWTVPGVLALPATTVESIVTSSPGQARDFLLTQLLGAWAEAEQEGLVEKARRIEKLTDVIVAATSKGKTGGLLSSAVQQFKATQGTPAGSRLQASLLVYTEGVDRMLAGSLNNSRPLLEKAQAGLTVLDSPIQWWVEIALAENQYFSDDYEEALKRLLLLEDQISGRGFYTLIGRLCELAGVAYSQTGRLTEGLRYYKKAEQSYLHAKEPASVASIQGRIAQIYFLVGRQSRAWDNFVHALRGSRANPDMRRRFAWMERGTIYARDNGLVGVALHFSDESVILGRRVGQDWLVAAALRWRVDILRELEDPGGALKALSEARNLARRVGDASRASTLALEATLAEAQILIDSDPEEATSRLETALVEFDALKLSKSALECRLELARAYRLTRRSHDAERMLRQALYRVDSQFVFLPEGGLRSSWAKVIQKIQDELIGRCQQL